jgi:hypothetical protein
MEDNATRVFHFTTKDRAGRDFEGLIRARDEDDAAERLRRRGYYSASFREANEEEVAGAQKNLEILRRASSRRSWRDALAYALPAVGVALGLIGLFIGFRALKPVKPVETPEAVVEHYLQEEKRADYDAEFKRFSRARQLFSGPRQDYIRRRTLAKLQDGSASYALNLGKIEAVSGSERRAAVAADVLRISGAARLEFGLINERGVWKIDTIRDPQKVRKAIDEIRESGGYDRAHDKVMALKADTGLSDLDIQKRLKNQEASSS